MRMYIFIQSKDCKTNLLFLIFWIFWLVGFFIYTFRNISIIITPAKDVNVKLREGGRRWWVKNNLYVGLTKRKDKKGWGEQKTSAKPLLQASSKPVGKHFSLKGHEVHDMKFVVIEKIRNKNPFVLKARESYWIKQYDAINHGLNIAD